MGLFFVHLVVRNRMVQTDLKSATWFDQDRHFHGNKNHGNRLLMPSWVLIFPEKGNHELNGWEVRAHWIDAIPSRACALEACLAISK